MQAKITVGVELAFVPKHADLVVADESDAALSVLELINLGDESFRHVRSPVPTFPPQRSETERGRGPHEVRWRGTLHRGMAPPPPCGACHRAGHFGPDPVGMVPLPQFCGEGSMTSRDPVAELTDPLDPDLYLVAGVEEFAAFGAGARRRAGEYQIAGMERHVN